MPETHAREIDRALRLHHEWHLQSSPVRHRAGSKQAWVIEMLEA